MYRNQLRDVDRRVVADCPTWVRYLRYRRYDAGGKREEGLTRFKSRLALERYSDEFRESGGVVIKSLRDYEDSQEVER